MLIAIANLLIRYFKLPNFYLGYLANMLCVMCQLSSSNFLLFHAEEKVSLNTKHSRAVDRVGCTPPGRQRLRPPARIYRLRPAAHPRTPAGNGRCSR